MLRTRRDWEPLTIMEFCEQQLTENKDCASCTLIAGGQHEQPHGHPRCTPSHRLLFLQWHRLARFMIVLVLEVLKERRIGLLECSALKCWLMYEYVRLTAEAFARYFKCMCSPPPNWSDVSDQFLSEARHVPACCLRAHFPLLNIVCSVLTLLHIGYLKQFKYPINSSNFKYL